jgi:opacity protein-like surface antigen
MGSSHCRRGLVVLLALVLVPAFAAAQIPQRSALGGFVSGSLGDGGPATAVGLSGTVPLTQALSIDVDASYLPRLDFGEIPLCPPEVLCILADTVRGGSYDVRGRSRSLTLSLVSRLPIRTGALQPYVTAGGGLANIQRELRDTQLPVSVSRSSTDPMVSVGGGVDIPVARRIVFGVEARYERAFGEEQFGRDDVAEDLSLTRVTFVVRYRF